MSDTANNVTPNSNPCAPSQLNSVDCLAELEADDFLVMDTQVIPESEESKKLNEYLYHRELNRPDVSWRTVPKYIFRWMSGAAVTSVIELLLLGYSSSTKPMQVSASGVRLFFILWCAAFVLLVLCNMKRIIVYMVKMYQKHASENTRRSCCCMPSCSEYMILAVNKYGVVIGVAKGIARLYRCGLFRGIDYP